MGHKSPLASVERTPALYRKRKRNSTDLAKKEHVEGTKALWRGKRPNKHWEKKKHCTEKSIVQKSIGGKEHRAEQRKEHHTEKHWQKRASCRTKPRLLMALQEHAAA